MTNSKNNSQPASSKKAQHPLSGDAVMPGDKSISHRAFILGGLARGTTKVNNLLESEDVLATGKAMQMMGAHIKQHTPRQWQITGVGAGGLTSPQRAINFGNSGTGARLVIGAMVGHGASAKCEGDASLSKRPMARITDPLTKMGAQFDCTKGQRLPLYVTAPERPIPLHYDMPIASAQVKSAVLLAGLGAPGHTSITESHPTRDHTERMLGLFGAQITTTTTDKGVDIKLEGEASLKGTEINVPGDPSSAAFPMVAALLVPHSRVTLRNIMVNPHRDGLWVCLREMGAKIEQHNERNAAGEIMADFTVRASSLKGINVPAKRAPRMIDEYPIFAMAAAYATGETKMTGLGELRVKESDRLLAIVNGLRENGVMVEEQEDTMTIQGCGGAIPGGGAVRTHLDHRIAMSFLVLGLAAQKPISVDNSTMIATSFPNFFSLMKTLNAPMTTKT